MHDGKNPDFFLHHGFLCVRKMTDRSSTQQRKQSFEDHDGCVDEETGDVGFHPPLKFIEESDSQFNYGTLRAKRLAYV